MLLRNCTECQKTSPLTALNINLVLFHFENTLWNIESQKSNVVSHAFQALVFFPSDHKPPKLFWLLHLIFSGFLWESPPPAPPLPVNIPSWEASQAQKLSVGIPRWTSATHPFIPLQRQFFLHQTRFTSKWLWQSEFPEQLPEDGSSRRETACSLFPCPLTHASGGPLAHKLNSCGNQPSPAGGDLKFTAGLRVKGQRSHRPPPVHAADSQDVPVAVCCRPSSSVALVY